MFFANLILNTFCNNKPDFRQWDRIPVTGLDVLFSEMGGGGSGTDSCLGMNHFPLIRVFPPLSFLHLSLNKVVSFKVVQSLTLIYNIYTVYVIICLHNLQYITNTYIFVFDRPYTVWMQDFYALLTRKSAVWARHKSTLDFFGFEMLKNMIFKGFLKHTYPTAFLIHFIIHTICWPVRWVLCHAKHPCRHLPWFCLYVNVWKQELL